MLIRARPQLTKEVISNQRSRFTIEPLEPGFRYTLGSFLQCTLLSSIPGSAVTSIKIKGALHEFTILPGVKEDVTQVVLDVKEIVLSSDSDEPVVVYLRKTGEGEVTVDDIMPPAGVAIHNPEHHIAALNKDGELETELTMERGRDYVSVAQNRDPEAKISRIPVGSIYSPVLKVSYHMEATRVERRTDLDRLIMGVETKRVISPRDAVASAGKTLVELSGLARALNADAESIELESSNTDSALAEDLAMSVKDLELTSRALSYSSRKGIKTVGDLVTRSQADLLGIRNFGHKSIDEIKEKLATMGTSLKGSQDPETDGGVPQFSDEF